MARIAATPRVRHFILHARRAATGSARPLNCSVRRHSCMASSTDTVQYIVDQCGLGRRITFKKMFGEFALYLDEKVVALVCDDQLYLKPTDQGKVVLGSVKLAPPYPGAKNHYLLTDELDDSELLKKAFLVTARALPAPKPKILKVAKKPASGEQGASRAKAPARARGKKRKSKRRT